MSESPTLAEVLQNAIRAEMLDIHTMLPARVEKYDSETQKASISPLIKKKYVDDEVVQLPVINDIPVQWPSGGDAFIHMPLVVGDTGMAVFAERSLDKWLSGNGKAVAPDDPRHHNITDAVFIPGIRTFTAALSGINGDSVHIKHGDAEIELTSGGDVNILGGNIKFGSGIEKAVLGDTLAALYALHTHLSAAPGVPTSIPSNILTTALSAKVSLE